MLATLLLAAALPGSPVPKDAKPAGPAPQVVELVPESDGKVRLTVRRTETRKVPQQVMVPKQVIVNGAPVNQVEVVTQEREITTTRMVKVELADVKDLAIYTADGKEADRALALKKIAEGGVVVVSADGKKVDPKYLKLFRDDALVLVSPELGTAQTGVRATTLPALQPRLINAPALRPVPLPAPNADAPIPPVAPLPAEKRG